MSGLVTFGESLVLLTTESVGRLRYADRLMLSFGGAESNVAIGVRRLGHEATWMGRVGADEFGRLVLARLRGEDVTTVAVTDATAPTALMFKERRPGGRTRVSYQRTDSAGARLCSDDLDFERIRSADFLHVTGITMALSGTARDAVLAGVKFARANAVKVSFDMNYRTALCSPVAAREATLELLAEVDVVFLNETELEIVAGSYDDLATAAKTLADLGPGEIVVTRGARGAFAVADGAYCDAAAVIVDAVDTVGAGDAFTAGYLSAMLEGADLATRLARGCECGASSVMSIGDWEGMPDQSDLELLRADTGSVVR